jgi:hypothetical protein
MNTYKIVYPILFFGLLSACQLRVDAIDSWSKIFRTQTDSNYYQGKSESLTNKIANDIEEYEINKITIMDFVDEENQTTILGEYLSSRIVEAFTDRSLFQDRIFHVTQKGEVNEVLQQLNLQHNFLYAKNDLEALGKSLNSQAVLTGKITDLGTNIDMHLTLTDVVTGEVISSATQHLKRTRFAIEMLRQH